jgi:hypothetical protein
MSYCCQQRLSIVLSWAHISTQFIVYLTEKTNTCWPSLQAHFDGGVIYTSCTVTSEKTAGTLYLNYFHRVTLRLAKIQNQKFWILHWWSLWGCGMVHYNIVCAPDKGGQYPIYGWLQPIANEVTQDAMPQVIDAPLTLSFWMEKWLGHLLYCL